MTDDAPLGAASLSPRELGAYFALMEVASLLQRAIDAQLRTAGDLSYVQFSILMQLTQAPSGQQRMTDLADGLVHSRSGLTYQAGLLAGRGLITRHPSSQDERSTIVEITDAGRALVADVLPGHNAVGRSMFFDPMSPADVGALEEVLTRVRDHMRTVPPRQVRARPSSPPPVGGSGQR